MSITVEQFIKRLSESGLMSPAEISTFHDGLPPEQRPRDVQTLAASLVKAGKLTKYQASAVYQGKTKGLVFGEYTILDKLGQGGMGVVLKAEHRRMKRLVAVKMIAGAALKSPDAVKRFYREVEAAARLNHPNIVQAYDASEHQGVHYLVMEHVDGKDLAAIVKEKGPLPVAQVVDCILQAARGLQYAHEEGLVHRDIKPANLLVDKKGTVKILDMGLARIGGPADEDDKDRLTASGAVMGTCDYMAPEQAFDTHSADDRADIYSLGCTLYRLLAGKSPYSGDTLVQILMAHREAPIPSLRTARADVPEELDGIFQKMVAKCPQDRYQSMTEVVSALEGFNSSARDEWTYATGITSQSRAEATRLRSSAASGTALAAKQRTADQREETFQRQTGETGRFRVFAQTLLAAPRRKRTLATTIGLSLLGVVGMVFLAVTIRVRHPDGKETSVTVPEGSKVTVSEQGDVDVAVKPESGRTTPPVVATKAKAQNRSESEVADLQSWDFDVLPRVNLTRDSVAGDWKRDGTTVSTTTSKRYSRIMLPLNVEGEYDLRVVFARHGAKNNVVSVLIPVGLHQSAVVLGGWGPEPFVALDCVGGKGPNENATTRPYVLAPEHQYTLLAKVRAQDQLAQVDVWLDSCLVIHWQGKESSLDVVKAARLPQSQRFGLLANVPTTFHSVQVRMVSGKARWTEAKQAPAAAQATYGSSAPLPAVAPFDAAKAKQHQEAWAKHLGVPVEETNSIGMKLALIPPGEFEMGSTPEEQAWAMEAGKDRALRADNLLECVSSEAPRHRVKITKPFYLAVYQVTQDEYKKVMGVNPSTFTENQMDASAFHPPLTGNEVTARQMDGKKVMGQLKGCHPVETVTYEDAMEFCRLLSTTPTERAARRTYRLPTEAEWEYACRAGTTTRWYCGDDEAGLQECAWFSNSSGRMTHPVGQKKPNAWGLYDMQGHVRQWCSDWYSADYYKQSPPSDPAGPADGRVRVVRGGDWRYNASDCRSACRGYFRPEGHYSTFGFRVVAEIAAQERVVEQPTTAPVASAPVNDGPNAPPPAVAPFDAAKAKQHQEAWAKHLGVPVEETNSIGMKLALIPPGEFEMGSTPEEVEWALEQGKQKNPTDKLYFERVPSESPRHRVKITKPFYLGMYQVTQGDYEKVMGINPTAYTEKQVDVSTFNPPLSDTEAKAREVYAKRVLGKDTSRHPVESVNWDEAIEFCRRLSAMPAERAARRIYRLPTEAEWEFACRAGTTTRWYCGDDEAGVVEAAWFNKNADGMTHPVGEKKPNALGLYDMHGNVWQWCSDWYSKDYYAQSPSSDPSGPAASSSRVLRGGNWSTSPCYCRSAYRLYCTPAYRRPFNGFRVVAEIAAQERVVEQPTTAPVASAPVNDGPNAPPPAVAPFDAAKAKQHQEAWAKHLGVPVEETNSIGMKLVLIPPGEFHMGSNKDQIAEDSRKIRDDSWVSDHLATESPSHRVKITRAFFLGMHEVTQAQYQQVMADNPSAFSPTGGKQDQVAGQDSMRRPVEMVSWDDAQEFCKRLTALPKEGSAGRVYRLPTEAQWEYACRAGTVTRWNDGNDPKRLGEYAWFRGNSERRTHPVGQKIPNAWELYDMYGNVREWCQDWYGSTYYQESPVVDPLGPSVGSYRVLRGGAHPAQPLPCSSTFRHTWHTPRTAFDGFRVLCEVKSVEAITREKALPKESQAGKMQGTVPH